MQTIRTQPGSLRGRFEILAIAGLVVTLSASCSGVFDLPLPPNAVSYAPPPSYGLWWSVVERCSGLSGDFREVSWYQVPGARNVPVGADSVVGYYQPVTPRVLMAGQSIANVSAVRHEMLHALLREKAANHPVEYYRDRCGGLVDCSGHCAEEVGAPVIPDGAMIVAPGQLEVDVESMPESPSASEFGGRMTLVLRVRNPWNQPVWVNLARARDGTVPLFGVGIYNGQTHTGVTASRRIGFAAGETRHYPFDTRTTASGVFALRGWFNAETTAMKAVSIRR
jgi:hypothetical protein